MTALASIFAEVTTQVTTTSTSFVDVSGATLSNASFTAGEKYLLIITANPGHATTSEQLGIQVIHGSTAFADSVVNVYPNSGRLQFAWFDVWTAVSTEDIKLQYKVAAGTGRMDQVCMLAVNINSLTENTDYFYAQRSDDDTITTAGVAGASVTFTPAGASNWIVLTYTQLDFTSTTASTGPRIVRSGEASSTTPIGTIESLLSDDEVWAIVQMRDFALTAASNTFSESCIAITSDNGTRLHSKIFVINRGLFAQSVAEYTAGPTSLSNTDYATNLETASITPAAQGDVVVLTFTSFDRQNAGREIEIRTQVDDADQPDTQTTDNYQFYIGRDARDVMPFFAVTRENMTAAAHTIDLDASSDSTTGTPECDDTQIVAFTLELAGAAGQPTAKRFGGTKFASIRGNGVW